MYNPSGRVYYSLNFEVVILFGLTEIQAQLRWSERVISKFQCEDYRLMLDFLLGNQTTVRKQILTTYQSVTNIACFIRSLAKLIYDNV
jgi:hypothetical protein